MALDPGAFGLLKIIFDQVAKRFPDTADKTRLRVQDELLRQSVDRNKELEQVADLLGRVEVQRDDLFREVVILRLRCAELEQKIRASRGE